MAQIVKCDICGKLYNQSYLSSHKRLSHRKREAPVTSPHSERETIELITFLYGQLSEENKGEVRKRLPDTGPSKT